MLTHLAARPAYTHWPNHYGGPPACRRVPPATSPAPLSAVSFDFYGTLLTNSVWEDEVALVRALARERGHLQLDAERFLTTTVARAMARTAGPRLSRSVLGAGATEALREQGVEDDGRPWGEALHAVMDAAPLYPEVRPVLDALHAAGVPLALVSNSGEDALRQTLAAVGILDRFQVVVSAERAGAYKPAPEPFRLAARELGLPPGAILHVGDSLGDDVRGAGAAGYRTAFVNRRGAALPEAGPRPDRVGRDLREALGDVLPGLL